MRREEPSKTKDNSKSDKKDKLENKEDNRDIKINKKGSSPESSGQKIKKCSKKENKSRMTIKSRSKTIKSSLTTHWPKWMTMITMFLMTMKGKIKTKRKKLIQMKSLMESCQMMMHT